MGDSSPLYRDLPSDIDIDYNHLPQVPEEPIHTRERRSLQHLRYLIRQFAPHLRRSFVCSQRWWRLHHGMAEAHVRSTNRPVSQMNLPLTVAQMFKYLLYRTVEDVLIVFSAARATPPAQIEDLIDQANAKAEPIWRDQETLLLTKEDQCRDIFAECISLNEAVKGKGHVAVPASIVDDLDDIFLKHYNSPEKFLLFGRTDDVAYEVQDRYAREVATLLGTVRRRFESRALTRLRKMYGRGSLPLLSEGSATAMWAVCKSSYYRRQIFLVSSACLACP